jgi:hypothetical protein
VTEALLWKLLIVTVLPLAGLAICWWILRKK